jgi:hypothetical protein
LSGRIGGYVRSKVAAVCLLAAGLAVAQPFRSFVLDTTVVMGPNQYYGVSGTRFAAGDSTALLIWIYGTRLRGTRITPDGTFLDTMPIDITGPDFSALYVMKPGLAWGDGTFLAAWSSWDRTYFALIDPNGSVVHRALLQDSVRCMQNASTAVAFDGCNFLVAWVGWSDEERWEAYFSRVTSQGVVLDSAPRLVVPAMEDAQYAVAAAYHGDRYLLVLSTYSTCELWGTFILPDGSVTDSAGFPIRTSGDPDFPAVTHDGHNFVVCWNERPYLCKLARVTDSGLVLDTSGVLVDTASIWQGDVYSVADTTLVAWVSLPSGSNDSMVIAAARVDTALRLIDSTATILSGRAPGNMGGLEPQAPSIGLLGDAFLVAWCHPFHFDTVFELRNAVYRRLDRSGCIIDTAAVIVSYAPNYHQYTDLAWDGSNFFAVWQDRRATPERCFHVYNGARFTRDGVLLDSTPIVIDSGVGLCSEVAYGAGVYLVCWSENSAIWSSRVSTQGILLDTVPSMVNPEGTRPDVAYADSVFLVVWYVGSTVYGSRLSPEGLVLDSVPILLELTPYLLLRNPRVDTDATSFLVTMYDRRADGIHGLRVSTEGEVLDSTEIFFGSVEHNSRTQGDIASGSGVYMVVADMDGPAWRMAPDGTVLDSAITFPRIYDHTEVVYDGTQFLIVGEHRDSIGEGVAAVRIAPSGRVIDSTPFHLVETAGRAYGRYGTGIRADTATGRVGMSITAYDPELEVYRTRAATFQTVIGLDARPDARPRLCQPTVVRWALPLSGRSPAVMFDITGRRVMDLKPGVNDVRHIAPGVYFVRQEKDNTTTKVVIQR